MTITEAGPEHSIEQFGDINSAIQEAVGKTGIGYLPDFITAEDAQLFCDRFNALGVGKIPAGLEGDEAVSWWNNFSGRLELPMWGDILGNIRDQVRRSGAKTGENFYNGPGSIKRYGPGGIITEHEDHPLWMKQVNVVVNFSNAADFSWIDENGQPHTEEVTAGGLTVVRDGIRHWAGAPKLPGDRIVGLLFS